MRFGLKKRDEENILKALSMFPEIERAIIFGSRAIGNSKVASGVDLTITGKNVTDKIVFRLRHLLNEEMPIPLFFDVVHYEKIKNENLRKHID